MSNNLISRSSYKERLLVELNEMRNLALDGKMGDYDIGYNNGLNMAFAMLLNEPTVDAVEVVRCKDCKHGEIDDPYFPYQYYCQMGHMWNDKYHFCADGERRADE